MFYGGGCLFAALPKNVALIRVTVKGRHIVIVSDKLNHDQQIAARVAAALLGTQQRHVMLSYSDVLAALHAAAA